MEKEPIKFMFEKTSKRLPSKIVLHPLIVPFNILPFLNLIEEEGGMSIVSPQRLIISEQMYTVFS